MYFKITTYYDPVGEKRIPSKCPDCGQDNCLELFFYQRRVETPFTVTVSKKVTGTLYCHNTQSEISPVLWNDEIQNYFDVEKTKQRLRPTSIKFNKWFYYILSVPLLIVIFSIAYLKWTHKQYDEQSASIKEAAVGDKVAVLLNLLEGNEITAYGNTWFKIRDIKGDTVFLQRHKSFTLETGFDFDLEDDNFTGIIFKVSLPQFKERNLSGFDFSTMQFSGYITEIKKQKE